MINMESTTIVHELERLAELYHRDLSEGLLALYLDVLTPYRGEEIVDAIRCHIRDPERGRFFPLPADLIRGMEGSPQNRSLVAWTRAVAAAENVGQYVSVDFGDSLLHEVIQEMGGWAKFLLWPEREDPFKQKEFRERYQALCERQHRGKEIRGIGYLPGISETTNHQTGYAGWNEVRKIASSEILPLLPGGGIEKSLPRGDRDG